MPAAPDLTAALGLEPDESVLLHVDSRSKAMRGQRLQYGKQTFNGKTGAQFPVRSITVTDRRVVCSGSHEAPSSLQVTSRPSDRTHLIDL